MTIGNGRWSQWDGHVIMIMSAMRSAVLHHSFSTLTKSLARLMYSEHLPESDTMALCDRVRNVLMEEFNIQP